MVPLNLAQLSIENPNAFNRDTIDTCIREVLGALSRCIASGRPVEFTFNGIGRLLIRDLVVKMKFFKNFMQTWDGTGKLVESLQGVSTRGVCFRRALMLFRDEYFPFSSLLWLF